jgi:hypothetical protein
MENRWLDRELRSHRREILMIGLWLVLDACIVSSFNENRIQIPSYSTCKGQNPLHKSNPYESQSCPLIIFTYSVHISICPLQLLHTAPNAEDMLPKQGFGLELALLSVNCVFKIRAQDKTKTFTLAYYDNTKFVN